MTRRSLGRAACLLLAPARCFGAGGIDDVLREAVDKRKIPAIAAMTATPEKITYSGAFGQRDSASGVPVAADSIFSIASMTKAVTTVAALQLVEKGKVKLDGPASVYLPKLAQLEVLQGFDAAGNPILRPASRPVTLKHLLTHTSGFAYDIWDESMFRYSSKASPGGNSMTPLAFEPGTRWQYGTGIDWAGRLVEAVSGQTLEEYFQQSILQPLGMKDTSYILPPAKFDRLVTGYSRQDGSLKQNTRRQPAIPTSFNGGGGLYSTTGDYTRFMQMILRRGRGPGNARILGEKLVALMTTNQIGSLGAGKMKTFRPEMSSEVLFNPGGSNGFTLGFLINREAYPHGRSAGSLAWAGLYNTFYWIDPRRAVCAVLMMQFLPFVDREAMAVLGDFERAVYASTS